MYENSLDGVLRPGGLLLTRCLIDYCRFKPGDRVIDIGCGTGITVDYLCSQYGLDAVGIDSSASSIRQGIEHKPGLKIQQASSECLPFFDSSFSGVLLECSLSVMKDARAVLAEMNRILLTGGKLAITDLYLRPSTDAMSPIANTHSAGNVGVMTCDEWISILKDNGFSTMVWEDRTEYLKEFIARYIMTYGSLEGLCYCRSPEINDQHLSLQTKKIFHSGYFLLVAKKTIESGTLPLCHSQRVPARYIPSA